MGLLTNEQLFKISEQVMMPTECLNRLKRNLKMSHDLYYDSTKKKWVLYINNELVFESDNFLKVVGELDEFLKGT